MDKIRVWVELWILVRIWGNNEIEDFLLLFFSGIEKVISHVILVGFYR